tara:strand:- start:947 stop:1237 length:291 start_codon:yes stop_codon:yes gene_type:complete
VGNCDVVGIDQGHLFTDIAEACEILANQGKTVIVAAMDGTVTRKPFQDIVKLIPLSEYVTKLTAVCSRCYGEAAFTQTQNELPKYVAICRQCNMLR